MGIYDRDYYRQSPDRGGFGHFVAWSITTWLIVVNVVVFFGDGILHRMQAPPPEIESFNDDPGMEYASRPPANLYGPLTQWGSFSMERAIYHGQVWRFVTFQFLHASPWHLIANMVGLYLFGPIVEAHFGSRRFIAFYLLCGLTGAVCFSVMALMHVLEVHSVTPLVGASAGIFGTLVAAALIAPDVQVFYYFIPITIGLLAIGGMLMAAYAVFATGVNSGGEAAHLGGGAGISPDEKSALAQHFCAAPRRSAVGARRRARAYQKDWSKDFNR